MEDAASILPQPMKTCSNPLCGKTLPLDQFHKDRTSKDGYRARCRQCGSLDGKAYRRAHPKPRRQRVDDCTIRNEHREKYCSKCQRWLSLDMFYPCAQSKDKLNWRCRDCAKGRRIEGYYQDRQRYQDYAKAYYQRNTEKCRAAARQAYAADTEKHRAACRAWGQKNKAKKAAQTHAWYMRTHEIRLAKARRDAQARAVQRKANWAQWYAKHRTKRLEYTRQWYQRNHDYKVARDNLRRAQQMKSPTNDFTKAQWQAMKAHYKHHCVYCGKLCQRLTMDHITPLARGGAHTVTNIVPACMACNQKKHAYKPLVPVQPLLFALEAPAS